MSNDNTPGPGYKFFLGCRNGIIIMAIFYGLVVLGYWWWH
jgi:hypothetical protein